MPDGTVTTSGDKLNQVYLETKTFLERVLSGYSLPEPFFTSRVKVAVETLMKCLKDPALPLYELRVGVESLLCSQFRKLYNLLCRRISS